MTCLINFNCVLLVALVSDPVDMFAYLQPAGNLNDQHLHLATFARWIIYGFIWSAKFPAYRQYCVLG